MAPTRGKMNLSVIVYARLVYSQQRQAATVNYASSFND